ncbi:MAG TPA: M14 family zinc carboxypeptidase [Saprospiraceae bacterium]|nr:M14 family zinc carboxypeptidase [Saprospiraceae bacterium]HMQ85481.1 M14 family zinc carboxypeptidase [Saprospiraceae bacterium]
MKRQLLLLSMTVLSCLCLSAQQETHSKLKINLEHTELSYLSGLGLETDHGQLSKGRFLINDFSATEMALLDAHDIEYEILIADVGAWYQDPSRLEALSAVGLRNNECEPASGTTYETPDHYEYGSMGGYVTYSELLETLDEMAAQYPHLISAKQPISNFLTHDERPIYWLRLSDNATQDEDEPEVLYTAVHHAREPNGLSQMIFYIWYLLEHYEDDPEVQYLVNNTEMYFVPCLNPDGYIYNELTNPDGGGLWRKNRRPDEFGNVHGVDLNRNYGYEWGADDFGSSPDPGSAVYRGPEPFSEPETQAISWFCNQHQFQIALNYHTYGNLLIHPWGYNDTPTEEDVTFKGFGQLMTRENNFTVGTGTETVGYVVNGGSDDWMYGEQTTKPKIYSMTPEVGPGSFGFWPPSSMIDELNKLCMLQNLTTAHLVLNYAEAEDQSADYFTALSGVLDFRVFKYGLQEGAINVSLQAVSDNISVNTGTLSFDMAHLDETTASFEFALDEDISFGEEVTFQLLLDNGAYVKTTTISKPYLFGEAMAVFSDDGSDISLWENQGNGLWGTSTEAFVSPNTSMTDSPGQPYPSNAQNLIVLQNPVDLTDGGRAFLRFWTKWDLEEGWDYVQVGISTDGVSSIPLCGKYTKPGSGFFQPEGSPLYDGTQSEWVLEEIDISEYLGSPQVYVHFWLMSDGFLNLDGFYFDDLEISVINEIMVDVDAPAVQGAQYRVQPNPFTTSFTLDLSLNRPVNDGVFVVRDVLGTAVYTQQMGNRTQGEYRNTLDVAHLPAGIYFLQVYLDGVPSAKVAKLVKSR